MHDRCILSLTGLGYDKAQLLSRLRVLISSPRIQRLLKTPLSLQSLPLVVGIISYNGYYIPYTHTYIYITGWWFQPSESISQLGSLFPIYGKIIQMFQTTNQNLIQSSPIRIGRSNPPWLSHLHQLVGLQLPWLVAQASGGFLAAAMAMAQHFRQPSKNEW